MIKLNVWQVQRTAVARLRRDFSGSILPRQSRAEKLFAALSAMPPNNYIKDLASLFDKKREVTTYGGLEIICLDSTIDVLCELAAGMRSFDGHVIK